MSDHSKVTPSEVDMSLDAPTPQTTAGSMNAQEQDPIKRDALASGTDEEGATTSAGEDMYGGNASSSATEDEKPNSKKSSEPAESHVGVYGESDLWRTYSSGGLSVMYKLFAYLMCNAFLVCAALTPQILHGG